MNTFKKYWKWSGLILLSVTCSIGLYIYHWEYRKPVLDVYFFSLNKGRAIFIRTPENKTILIGGGQNSEIIRELTKAMPFYSRTIDTIITPSAVPAQIGGLIEVIDRYEIGEILMPKIMSTSTVLTELTKEIRKKKIHTEEVERGDEIHVEKDLTLDVLFPYTGFKFNKTSLPELGLFIEYKKTGVYLIGNLSKTIQKDILKNSEIKTDENIVEFYNTVGELKVSSELLEKIKPQFTFSTKEKTTRVISDGFSWNQAD